MFTLFQNFKPDPVSAREQSLSNQVDHLSFELAKTKRELETARMQKADIQQQFDEHRLRDYPAAGSWVNSLQTKDLFNDLFENPVEYVLSDAEKLGYDVSAAWMVHRATLDLARQQHAGVERIQNMAKELAESRSEFN